MACKARPRVLFLSQWFEPEGAFKGLHFVQSLRDGGFDVDVVTGLPNYPLGKLFPGYEVRLIQREVMEGIRVTRLPLYPSHDSSILRRSATYLSFLVSAFLYTLLRRSHYDVIYVYHPPITVGLAAALSGLIRRTPFILDVQDLWPEGLSATGMVGARMEWLLALLCNFTYRRAAAVVAQSNGMNQALRAHRGSDDRVRTILNWGDEIGPRGLADLRPYGFDGRFTFTYAGNMGPPQALEAVVEAARIASARDPRIQLLLIGSGISHASLRERVKEQGVSNVKVMPPLPGDQIGDVLAASDVLVIHLANTPASDFTIPSKTQNYLASGKPILAGLSGEAASLVHDAGAGEVVPPQDVEQIAAAMVRLAAMPTEQLRSMGEQGRRFYREHLSYARALQQTVGLIDDVSSRSRGRGKRSAGQSFGSHEKQTS